MTSSDFRRKLSYIGHSELAILSPFAPSSVDRFVAALRLPEGGRALDVGCGKGEWLIRIAQRYAVTGLGVDRAAPFIEAARTRARDCLGERAAACEFRCEASSDQLFEDAAYDLAFCIGATSALGGFDAALAALARAAKPDGLVAIGEGFWERPPAAELHEALGEAADGMYDYAGVIAAAASHGLVPQYAITSSQGEWDEYEWSYRSAIERYAREVSDPDAPALLEASRADLDRYLRLFRGTVGFGVFLFRRPAQ